MIIVTNRRFSKNASATRKFGKEFNLRGPDELMIAKADKIDGKWNVQILPEKTIFEGKDMFSSEKEFIVLQKRLIKDKKNCLLFIHGFNNDFDDVLERGLKFEKNYNVEVIVFTWPANGRITGGLEYKSDKRDAVRSVAALDRVLEKLDSYMNIHGDAMRRCNRKISLFMHSMGNYLFKHLMKSSIYNGETTIFDNVIMCAADVNNRKHSDWVDRISFRKRLYITINEDDKALLLSRMKFGKKQHARLGHSTKNLTAKNATYLDFSQRKSVNCNKSASHAYFEDKPIERDQKLKEVFNMIINGEVAEIKMKYEIHSGTFTIKD